VERGQWPDGRDVGSFRGEAESKSEKGEASFKNQLKGGDNVNCLSELTLELKL